MHFSLQKTLACAAISLCMVGKVFAQPANNVCGNAKLITPGITCTTGSSFTGETLSGATNDGYSLPGSCGFSNATDIRDVWYKFVARSKTPTITINNIGSGWGGLDKVKVQLLSNTCGSGATEFACGTGVSGNSSFVVTPTLANPLVEGTTYLIRIHNNTNTVAASSTFDICVTDLSKGSRMNEVFAPNILSGASTLNFPWEVTYGPDNNLWVTESKGYKVYKINPTTAAKTMILDISQGSTFLPLANRAAFNCQFANGAGAQGGLAGLALHPNFLDGTGSENNSVYISYVYSSNGGSSPSGIFFTNKLVRFTYNKVSGLLESPVSICDTLPGSSDHNSQRMIIAPVAMGGTKYLFYAEGDMGGGQFGNRDRANKSQNHKSYEGKILRFNLSPDANASNGYNEWIPDSNPYNAMLGVQSAVYSIGIRNNQGFAYDAAANILYGTSHGPYSDDELNIIEPIKNYGHPLVIGYAADGNYNGTTTASTNTSVSAGAAFTDNNGNSSCPPIGNEVTNMNNINLGTTGQYKDPVFSAYPATSANIPGPPVITGIAETWRLNPGNGGWQSEGWSGLDLYTNKMIPGWKKSLVAAGLKWGRLIRLPLDATGTKTLPSGIGGAVGNSGDTITYFQSSNRYRDIAFAPNGNDVFVVMDNNSATSGPGSANPVSPACPGCLIKYSFLGYQADGGSFSTIPKSINVSIPTANNTCEAGNTITIDNTNNFLWVPVTGADGNILAEINAMGQNLGAVTTSIYKNSGAIRLKSGVSYLDRNITITPTVNGPYATPVKIRLYIDAAEFITLKNDANSGLSNSVTNLRIIKNNDPCSTVWTAGATTTLTPANTLLADITQGASGYVLQSSVTSFSSFYFAKAGIVVVADFVTLNGALDPSLNSNLTWKTTQEVNTKNFELQRSIDATNFKGITMVDAVGNSNIPLSYGFIDKEAIDQQATILYYRLKITNTDGSYKFSNIITINLPVTKASIAIAPNPVVADLKATITSPTAGNALVRIYDNTGRVVLQTTVYIKKGNNNFIQNINQLAKGAYYIDITGNNIISRSKFEKL